MSRVLVHLLKKSLTYAYSSRTIFPDKTLSIKRHKNYRKETHKNYIPRSEEIVIINGPDDGRSKRSPPSITFEITGYRISRLFQLSPFGGRPLNDRGIPPRLSVARLPNTRDDNFTTPPPLLTVHLTSIRPPTRLFIAYFFSLFFFFLLTPARKRRHGAFTSV